MGSLLKYYLSLDVIVTKTNPASAKGEPLKAPVGLSARVGLGC